MFSLIGLLPAAPVEWRQRCLKEKDLRGIVFLRRHAAEWVVMLFLPVPVQSQRAEKVARLRGQDSELAHVPDILRVK